jgi:hypothetical protein
VTEDTLTNLPLLHAFTSEESWDGHAVNPRVLILGEGRGAHTALAYSLFYPDETAAVATVGPAPCIMPATAETETQEVPALPFPFGISDLEQYSGDDIDEDAMASLALWLGVTSTDDVDTGACAWGALAGRPPEERARTFTSLVRRVGAKAEIAVAPASELAELRDGAIRFLEAQSGASAYFRPSHAPVAGLWPAPSR